MSNSLTEIDAKGNVVPDLAESFEPSDGAKKWVFKLRKGVTFHNGKTGHRRRRRRLVPHHMVDRIRSRRRSRCSTRSPSIKADGAETVVFELDGGNADFPYIVSATIISRSCRRRTASVDWQSGIRTGPFMLEKFEPGVIANLQARTRTTSSPTRPGSTKSRCLAINDVDGAHQRAEHRRCRIIMDRADLQDARHAQAESRIS